ncbi:MAG TPA: hypothetical protein PKD32_10595 [Saprospiraceae bacterium]|nr:hypothetical protein [Saprospiraceae bacterium]
MRLIFLVIFQLWLADVSADYICHLRNVSMNYIYSDAVAIVEIKSAYSNSAKDRYYKSDVVVEQSFKGSPFQSILVSGTISGHSVCGDRYFPIGSRILIFGSKINGNVTIDKCSLVMYINELDLSELTQIMNLLLKLQKQEHPKIPFIAMEWNEDEVNSKLKYQLGGKNINENHEAVFKVYLDLALQVTKVETIQSWGEENDQIVQNILKEAIFSQSKMFERIFILDNYYWILHVKRQKADRGIWFRCY